MCISFAVFNFTQILTTFFSLLSSSITISTDEYKRLQQNEVQLQKYKVLCEKKAKELKRVNTQLSYYRKQANKRSGQMDNEDSSLPGEPDSPNVK